MRFDTLGDIPVQVSHPCVRERTLRPVWTVDSRGDDIWENPTSLAVSSEGEIFVLDAMAHSISKLDTLGNFIQAFGREGKGPGELQDAADIAMTRNRLVVLNGGRTSVEWWDPRSGEPEIIVQTGLQTFGVEVVDDTSVIIRGTVGNEGGLYLVTQNGAADIIDLSGLEAVVDDEVAGCWQAVSRRGRLLFLNCRKALALDMPLGGDSDHGYMLDVPLQRASKEELVTAEAEMRAEMAGAGLPEPLVDKVVREQLQALRVLRANAKVLSEVNGGGFAIVEQRPEIPGAPGGVPTVHFFDDTGWVVGGVRLPRPVVDAAYGSGQIFVLEVLPTDEVRLAAYRVPHDSSARAQPCGSL